METEDGKDTQLTREQLYALVWSEPMQVLGPRFGLSDVGLKKICKKLRVPTPGRGYWAKKAVGAAPRATPLPKLPASVPPAQQQVTFGRPARPSPRQVEEAVGPVSDQKRYEAQAEHRIVVAESLADPHKLVAASVLLLRQARSNEQHRLLPRGKRCLAVEVTLGTADRAMLIYDALLKACAARGWAADLKDEEKGTITRITVQGEPIGIVIEERVERVERKPDPKANRTYYYKEYDYTPTGRLTVRIQVSYLGVRQTWSDGSKQRVEECLNDVMVGLVVVSEALKAQRREREARELEWRAQEERRQKAERSRQEEAARIRALNAELTALRKSRVAREYAAGMREAASTGGQMDQDEDLRWWLEWVEKYADQIDPTRAPKVPNDPGSQHSDARGYW